MISVISPFDFENSSLSRISLLNLSNLEITSFIVRPQSVARTIFGLLKFQFYQSRSSDDTISPSFLIQEIVYSPVNDAKKCSVKCNLGGDFYLYKTNCEALIKLNSLFDR